MKYRVIVVLFILLLSACTIRKQVERQYTNNQNEMQSQKYKLLHNKVHVLNRSYATKLEYGSIVPDKINISIKQKSLKEILNSIYPSKTIINTFPLDSNIGTEKYDISYTGDKQEFLNYISELTNIYIHIEGMFLYLRELQGAIYDIHFIYGKSEFIIGEVNPFIAAQKSGSNVSISGSAVADSFVADAGHNNDLDGVLRFTQSESSEEIWTELEKNIKPLISNVGQYEISETNSFISILDKPRNVKYVKKFLDAYNSMLSKQVLLKLKIIEVSFDDASQQGIDWRLVYDSADRLISGSGNARLTNNIISGFDQLSNTLTFGGNSGDLAWSIIYKSLQEQGKVTVKSEPMITLLNSQPGSIKIKTSTSYLAQISTTQQQVSTTQALDPGVIVTGFNAFFLPNIIDDRVILQITTSLSDLIQINESGPIATGESIQLPETRTSQFTQRLSLKNNSSTLLSIFSEDNATLSDKSLFEGDPLGASGARHLHTEILVLITPVIEDTLPHQNSEANVSAHE